MLAFYFYAKHVGTKGNSYIEQGLDRGRQWLLGEDVSFFGQFCSY